MDLTTAYLGLTLKHPLVASSSPLTGDFDTLRRLEDAGAAAVVLPSIFEEQIEFEANELERLTGAGEDSTSETSSYFPASASFITGPHRYLELIRRAREALQIPVIASLNGMTDHGWTDYAKQIQQAGASALELNTFFVPVESGLDGRAVEHRHIDVLRAVKAATSLPVAVKLAPYFSAVGDVVHQLQRTGAAGVVLFNRFYQPDMDLAAMQLRRDLALSTPVEIRLSLLWIGVLVKCRPVRRRRIGRGRRRGGHQVSAGRCRRGDDRVRAAASWRRPHAHHGQGADRLAGSPRAGVDRRHPRQAEPASARRPGGVRARELHQHPAKLARRTALKAQAIRPHHRRLAPDRHRRR